MNEINNGGPAFPCEVDPTRLESGAHQTSNTTFQQYGLSLRDYFAAKAMQGMLADSDTRSSCPVGREDEWTMRFAEACYEFADAMIKAREQKS